MTPPNNRYDRLSELDGADAAPVFEDESWIQAPDGSWIRSTDKAARKLVRKAAKRGGIPTQASPVSPPAPPPPPPPAAEPESKRRLGRKSAADKERDAALVKQVEREREERRRAEQERQAELDRQAELEWKAERERQAELERQRLAEFERQHQLDLERHAEIERQSRERERQAELERARAAELEREIERERARVADLERQVELERQRKADLDSSLTSVGSDTGSYWREPGQYQTHWPEDRPVSAPPVPVSPTVSTSKHASKPAKVKAPKQKAESKPKPAHGRGQTGQRIVNGAMMFGLVLATLGLGAGINWLGPDPAHALRPFTESGTTGQTIEARAFTVAVQSAKAAPALQMGKAAVPTEGAWVVVHVSVAATKEPTHIGYVALRDKAGRTFLATDRVTQPLLDSARTFQPGIGMQGDVVFEVPKDSLPGLTALFAAQPDHLGLDTMASVDLPPLALADGQPPVSLAPTEVKP